MGRIKQGILSGFSGKVGPVIGASWKGITYMRGIAQSIANPQTAGQLDVRAKFSLIAAFCQPVSQFLQASFKAYAVRMTGINAAFAYNIQNAVTGAYPNYAVDYPNALVARGSLAGALNQAAASTVAGTAVFTWDDNSGEIGASAIDKTMLLVINPVKKQAVSVSQLAERADGTQTITLPSSFSGDLVQCYINFIDAAGEVSNSAFAGAVTIA